MTKPESYGPKGGHMGITGWAEDCHRTAVDLEDTGAALSVAQQRIAELEVYIDELEALVRELKENF